MGIGGGGGGIRIKTYYSRLTDSSQPAVTDLTVGQDQLVTGGLFGRPVFHYSGFWPVPKTDFIFIAFGGSTRMGGNDIGFQEELNLAPVSTTGYTGPLTGPDFVQTSSPMYAADSFWVGIAADPVDLVKNHLLKAHTSGQ